MLHTKKVIVTFSFGLRTHVKPNKRAVQRKFEVLLTKQANRQEQATFVV